MKFLSTLRNRLRTNLLKNNRGQGATEYILLLVVVVGLVLAFKDPVTKALKTKIGSLEQGMEKVTVE